MAKLIEWWKTHRPTTRRLVQVYAALLYNANLKGFISGNIYSGNVKVACVPGLNCYSCPGAIGACPLGALQNALAASGHVAPWYMFGILLLFGIIAGRTICGWICPIGLIQELLHKIPVPKLRKSKVTRILSYLKYVILVVFAITIPLIYGLGQNKPFPAFCKFICPAGTLDGAVALLSNPANEGLFAQLGILFTRKFVILVIIILASVFIYRVFCRFLCPLGAIYSLFNRFCIVGVKVDTSRCTQCGACVAHCEMDIRHVGDHECISCGKCINTCAQGAISLKCASKTLKGPQIGKNADPEPVQAKRRRNGRIAWGILLAILVFALIYFNVIDVPKNSPVQAETTAVTDAIGAETDGTADGTETVTADGTGDADAAAVAETEAAAGDGSTDAAEKETVTVDESTDADGKEAVTVDGSTDADEKEAVTVDGSTDAAGTETADGAAAADYTSTAPIGAAVGQQLEDFTCKLLDGSEFHLADTRGKIVIINQWATYCTPCLDELPYFEKLKEEHPDVVVLAFHNWLEAKPTATEYIEQSGYTDWKVLFTVDTTDMNILNKVNGNNAMPRTIVLNRKGEVVFNEQRSVTYEMLQQLLEKAERAS